MSLTVAIGATVRLAGVGRPGRPIWDDMTTMIASPDESGSVSPADMSAIHTSLSEISIVAVVPLDGKVVPAGVIALTDGHSDLYPDLSNLTVTKVPHRNLILEGISSNCACCNQDLTDAVSIQRGIGPICSRRAYDEDPVDGDEIAAMIHLSPWPELVSFLAEHYKPLGVRGLVNGLVRVASLNRPHGKRHSEGNEDLFRSICNSVEELGYASVAKVLRAALIVAWLVPAEGRDGFFFLKTKLYCTPKWFSGDIVENCSGVSWDEKKKAFVIPVHKPGAKDDNVASKVSGKTNRRVIWETLLKAFEGGALKLDKEIVPIRVKKAA